MIEFTNKEEAKWFSMLRSITSGNRYKPVKAIMVLLGRLDVVESIYSRMPVKKDV